MRFGFKIFLMAFSLVVITINIIGINLINNTYETNLKNAIDKHSVEINYIMNSVTYYSSDNIVSIYFTNGIYTKIYINDTLFSTNFSENYPDIESILRQNLKDNINTYISEEKLFMAYKNKEFTVITLSDISDIYEIRRNDINYFIKISLSASFLVAIILSALVSIITHKLKKLNKSVEQIKKGNYNVKIPNLGHDEIGDFATSFEHMATSIKHNINEIKTISENRKIFIGNLTHEIKTPLTSIIGYSSLIKNRKVTNLETINNYATKIHEEGKYIENMRDKLMNLLTLEANKIELTEMNISKLLLNYLKDLQNIYASVNFYLEITPNVIQKIDETLFKSLIINLVKNSINASSNPKIKIVLKPNLLYVIDNGKGIPPSKIEKIKEPFYTLNQDRNRANSGMGLGFPLCLNIIKIHNWHLDITSIENKGTKIKITFEVKK